MAFSSSLARVTSAVLSLAVATALIVAVAVETGGGPAPTGGASVTVGASGGVLTRPSASQLKSIANLPPSHDNDAGHSRIIDTTPDADIDWYQFHH